MSTLTVVIPAHNEETVIARAIQAVTADGGVDVIVIANGCTDATSTVAAKASGRVRVIEIPQASKTRALNAVPDVDVYPIVYVDADVVVSGRALRALAERLEPGGWLVASPRMQVTPSPSWWVRQYYRVWALTDYRTEGHIGSGVYMLTTVGRSRFEEFPDVIADDLFVQRLFALDERLTPDDLVFSVDAPATLRSLLHRNTRIAAGNRELATRYPELAAPTGSRSLVSRVWYRPSLWVGFAVYSAVYLVAHRRAARLLRRREAILWSRDESTRGGIA